MPDIFKNIKLNGLHTQYQKDRNNCSVNALSSSFDISYDKAHTCAKDEWNRKDNKGVEVIKIRKWMGSPLIKFNKHIKQINLDIFHKQYNVIRNMTISSFINKHPSGTYYIIVKEHALVIKDGEVLDNKCYLNKFKRPIQYAWEICPNK